MVSGPEVLGRYAVMLASLLGPFALVAGMISGVLAAGLYLFGRLEFFWATTAPLNLGFVCLVLAELLVQLPSARDALIMVVLGARP